MKSFSKLSFQSILIAANSNKRPSTNYSSEKYHPNFGSGRRSLLVAIIASSFFFRRISLAITFGICRREFSAQRCGWERSRIGKYGSRRWIHLRVVSWTFEIFRSIHGANAFSGFCLSCVFFLLSFGKLNVGCVCDVFSWDCASVHNATAHSEGDVYTQGEKANFAKITAKLHRVGVNF